MCVGEWVKFFSPLLGVDDIIFAHQDEKFFKINGV